MRLQESARQMLEELQGEDSTENLRKRIAAMQESEWRLNHEIEERNRQIESLVSQHMIDQSSLNGDLQTALGRESHCCRRIH